jgi:LSD1 subclass zinc finger protein
MNAHDVRFLRLCKGCDGLGDRRRMLNLPDGAYHDHCAIARNMQSAILKLPAAERNKITIGAAGPELMRKLMEMAHLELVADRRSA